MTNIYVSFKDREIYKKMKYSCIHRFMFKTDMHIAIEMEFISNDSNWHSGLPFEHIFKEAEENILNNIDVHKSKELISFYAKYRKWQKRKLYTIDEFNELFEPLNLDVKTN